MAFRLVFGGKILKNNGKKWFYHQNDGFTMEKSVDTYGRTPGKFNGNTIEFYFDLRFDGIQDIINE